MVSFAVQKLLSFIKSHLFIFVFIFITLGGGSKKKLLRFMSKSDLPMFSSKSFIVSGLTFRSLIHLGVTPSPALVREVLEGDFPLYPQYLAQKGTQRFVE